MTDGALESMRDLFERCWALPEESRPWNALNAEVQRNPEEWWSFALQLIDATEDITLASRAADHVLGRLIRDDPTRFVPRTLAWAASSPKALSCAVEAISLQDDVEYGTTHQRLYRGLSNALRLIPYELVRATFFRHFETLRVSERSTWDLWVVEIGFGLGEEDPEQCWQLLLRLIADAPDHDMLGSIGAGMLESFCWQAAPEFLQRIEERAAADPRFRRALSFVWPGGDRLPPEIYARIRAAASDKT